MKPGPRVPRLGAPAVAAAVAALALVLPAPVRTQAGIEVLPVQGQVHLIAGAGANVTALVGTNGVLLVDTGREAAAEGVVEAVRALSAAPIHYIVNTSADADHIGGNVVVARAGSPAPGYSQPTLGQAPIYAHENAFLRLAAPDGAAPPLAAGFWPTSTFFTAKHTLFVSDEPIELLWLPAAHSDGDLMVFFRRSDVISVGDVMNTEAFPMIDLQRGGGVQGIVDALNRVIDMTIPELNQMGGTRVVPGHGHIANEADVVEYRDMVTIVRDRVQALVDEGRTLEEVQAARPAYEYEPLYGAGDGDWTTAAFVEAVYRSLRSGAGR